MNLDKSISYINGVGPKIQEKMEKLGIYSVRNLIYFWPRTWQDFSKYRPIAGLRLDDEVILKVKIKSVEEKRSHKKWMSIIEAILVDEHEMEIKAIWFNQTFLKNVLKVGDEWLMLGKVGWDFKAKAKTFTPTQMEKEPIIVPIYHETTGVTSKFIRKIIRPILMQNDLLEDYLPDEILKKEDLARLIDAVRQIHFPKNNETLRYAKKRLAFDELFLISLRFLTIKKELQQNVAPEMSTDENLLKDFVGKLPFKLTDAQRKTAWEIIKDLTRTIPMNRLLEGDVGSGKTVVAAMAAIVAIKSGYQVVWLAPTEILANQHFQNVTKILAPYNTRIGLLTGANKKADLINDNLIIGTHALIQKNVEIPNLGLIIIDEQHRFGVAQRAHLRKQKSDIVPHLLSMTATPIPRTLALALYGDLDISIINQMPEGRQKIETRIVEPEDRDKAYDFIENEIAKGRQAFVICPLIEEKESEIEKDVFESERKSVVKEFKKLQEQIFPKLKIGLMHGKLKSNEKAEVMEKFKNKEIDILVSTAVVEVGIDISNATVMMIEDADRFGLAQLHQFRGRVGRGADQAYCFLFSASQSAKTKERLEAMVDCFDGFELAQKDLELRGAGEIVGLAQSGLEDLKMASLTDTVMLADVRRVAEEIVEQGLEKYPLLAEKLKEFEVERHLE
ncbi:MAG: ATP-dependent DNA helicase RecG [Candidatus Berkelbacteria bacterium]